jgi:hypothetical protein
MGKDAREWGGAHYFRLGPGDLVSEFFDLRFFDLSCPRLFACRFFRSSRRNLGSSIGGELDLIRLRGVRAPAQKWPDSGLLDLCKCLCLGVSL